MSKRNRWRYKFVRHEINYSTKEECIYINGALHQKRAIYGGILGLFQSDFLLDFINDLGEDGWELQSELGSNESRALTFKQLVVGGEENEGLTKPNIDKRELKKLNKQLSQFKYQTISTLTTIEKSLVKIQAQLERTSQDELISTKGINYRHLHNLLSIGNWREADKETYRILLKAFYGEELKGLSENNIKQFPNEDLLIINRLWMEHSNGRFSYSTQKRLLEDLSARLDSDKRALYLINEEFGSLVGWRHNSKWLSYQQLTFNLSAPEGHLPTVQVGWHTKGDWFRYVQFLSQKVF